MKVVELRRVATTRVSNVNKHTVDDERPVRLCNYTDVTYNATVTPDLQFMSATASGKQIASFTLFDGDTVITKDSETAEDIGIATHVVQPPDDLVCGYHLAILRPGPQVHPKYLTWALRAGPSRRSLSARANGMTRVGISYDAINRTPIPLHDYEQQRRIADFLDDQTTRIDAAVAARRRQRTLALSSWPSLLTEHLNSVAAPRARLSRVATVQSGLTINDAAQRLSTGASTPYLSVSNVKDGYLDLTVVKEATVSPAQGERFLLRHGDVLMTEGGDLDKLGRGTVWESQIERCLHQNHVFAVRPRPADLDPWFLSLQTQAAHARTHFMLTASKSTNLASTSAGKVLALPLAVPPLALQRDLATTLRRERTELDVAVAAFDHSIALLTEYKQSLITAAVSGELDVTTASGRGMPA